ncbi:MAG: hypothetical protein IK997_06990, partial [Bacilli bacterium]|nr:hypothetical protein [Bacilli bacterium]
MKNSMEEEKKQLVQEIKDLLAQNHFTLSFKKELNIVPYIKTLCFYDITRDTADNVYISMSCKVFYYTVQTRDIKNLSIEELKGLIKDMKEAVL